MHSSPHKKKNHSDLLGGTTQSATARASHEAQKPGFSSHQARKSMYLCVYVACLLAYMYNITKEIRRVDLQFLFRFVSNKY